MLVSLLEWDDIKLNTISADSVRSIARNYSEGDIKGWRIPTKAEAQRIKETYLSAYPDYSENLAILNSKIEDLGGITLRPWDETKSSAPTCRYFCSDADSTFAIRSNSTISKAGNTVSYNLRLVRDTTITTKTYEIKF